MEDQRGLAMQKIGDRLLERLRAHPEVVLGLLCAAGGFLTALARIDRSAAPFGTAFVAGVPQLFLLPSVLGAALGYLTAGTAAAWRSAAAVLLCAVVRLAVGTARWEKRREFAAPLLAAGAVLGAGVAPVFYADPLVYDAIMWSAQVVMAGAAAGFMEKACAVPGRVTPEQLLSRLRKDKLSMAAAVVICAIVLMGLNTVALSGVSLGRIAAGTVVLFVAAAAGEAASALAGIACGLVIGFSTGEFMLYVTSYSMGGLLAGLFSAFGRKGSAATFAAVYGIFGLMLQKSPAGLIEVALASVLFLLLPRSLIYAAGVAAVSSPDLTLRDLSVEKLECAAQALREVSRTTEDVARRLKAAQDAAPGGLCDTVAREICGGCPYRCACWQEHLDETSAAIRSAVAEFRRTGFAPPEALPRALDRCARKPELAEGIRRLSLRRSLADERQARSARCRRIVTEELEAVGAALGNLADGIVALRPAPAGLMQRFNEVFADLKLEPRSLLCWKDEYGHLALRVAIPKYRTGRIDAARLTERLTEAACVPLTLPERTPAAHEVALEFRQKPMYALEVATCRLAADSPPCGDTVRQLTTPGGAAHILLSDGMGSGSNAALDSAMAASLAECLLEADIDYQSALRLINAALLVKSGDESLATLDALRIDLYTGNASFFKAGAAPSVLLRGGHAAEIASSSLPAGILDGVEFEIQERRLSAGDLVLMTSDGASPEGAEWMLALAENWKGDDLESFCRRLAKTAQLRRSDGRQDDISVVAARLSRLR